MVNGYYLGRIDQAGCMSCKKLLLATVPVISVDIACSCRNNPCYTRKIPC